jgi:RNA polymerase sigma factor (sigma-70 family)
MLTSPTQGEAMTASVESLLHSGLPKATFLGSGCNRYRSRTKASHAEHALSFDELIAPHVEKIFRTAYRITRNREDAEDAMQDALLQALLHFADFDGRSAFGTWLTRIAINSSLMILRKRKNARTVSLDGASDSEDSKTFQEVRDPAPDAEERYLQKERETTLRDAINALRPSLRNVVELGDLGERSTRETAETIGVSVSAAKARLFHAREALRKSRKLRRFRNDQRAHDKSSTLAFRIAREYRLR